jgi:hypothetical protein
MNSYVRHASGLVNLELFTMEGFIFLTYILALFLPFHGLFLGGDRFLRSPLFIDFLLITSAPFIYFDYPERSHPALRTPVSAR